jgi:hypothetical protein
MDDILARSIRAFRNEHPATALDAMSVRRRVLARAGARQHRKLFALRLALPVAATFAVSAALAATPGALPRLDEVRAWLGIGPTYASADPPTPERVRSALATATPPQGATEPIAPAPQAPADDAASRAPAPSASNPPPRRPRVVKPPPPRVVLESTNAPAPSSAPPLEAPVPVRDARPNLLSADLAAYQRAHRLHFHGGDPAAALRAWDGYLAAYPAGTFAPEARFNRAVCLLRLGRRGDAKAILVPIAGSSFAYGRERARALLTAME